MPHDKNLGPKARRVETILCAVDDSAHAPLILQEAGAMAAQLQGVRLILFSAATAEIQGTSDGPIAEREADAERRTKLRLEKLKDDGGVACEVLVGFGKPAHAILEAASRTGAELIVLGTAGRTGIRRVIMGSTAEAVLRDSPIPVLVFPVR